MRIYCLRSVRGCIRVLNTGIMYTVKPLKPVNLHLRLYSVGIIYTYKRIFGDFPFQKHNANIANSIRSLFASCSLYNIITKTKYVRVWLNDESKTMCKIYTTKQHILCENLQGIKNILENIHMVSTTQVDWFYFISLRTCGCGFFLFSFKIHFDFRDIH